MFLTAEILTLEETYSSRCWNLSETFQKVTEFVSYLFVTGFIYHCRFL